jgi:outer membrane lipoprotein-sorting protein/peroxiredoxin
MKTAAWWVVTLAGCLCAQPGSALAADSQAEMLLEQARAATARVQTLKADLWFSDGKNAYLGQAALKRPNLARVELKGLPMELTVSDGQTVLAYYPQQHRYARGLPGPAGHRIPFYARPLDEFFHPADIGRGSSPAPAYRGRETVDGTECEVVVVEVAQPQPATVQYFIGRRDGLVRRVVTVTRKGTESDTTTAELRNLQVNVPLDEALFRWTPPANAEETATSRLAAIERQLLAPGSPAPELNLPTAGGGPLSLAGALAGKKAALVVFWSYGAPASRSPLPLLQRLSDEFKDRGLVVVGVNLGDSEAVAAAFWKEQAFTFPLVLGGPGLTAPVAQAYRVQGYPTTYLVGADRQIRWRAVGFDTETEEKRLRDALAAVGLR